jgi:hypothetical protein
MPAAGIECGLDVVGAAFPDCAVSRGDVYTPADADFDERLGNLGTCGEELAAGQGQAFGPDGGTQVIVSPP